MDRRIVFVLTGCIAPALVVGLGVLAVVGAGLVGGLTFSDDLYPHGDFTDVTREEAALAGYTVPVGAEHVHVKDRSLQDVRVTWFAFDLPPAARAELSAQYDAADDPTKTTWSGALPRHWPQWTSFEDFDRPGWWAPAPGDLAYTRESRDGGAMIVFGRTRVFNLLWTFEGWTPNP